MPFVPIHDPQLNLVIHEGHGNITFQDIEQELIHCFGSEGWTRNSIWDLRDASLQALNSEEVRILAEQAVEFARIHSGVRNAWVAVNDLDYAFCRMSEMLADGAGLKLGVFKDFEPAKAWIQES